MAPATKKILGDTVEWVKVSRVAWQKDGFYYSRYPAPEKGHEKASINENHEVYFHKVGTTDDERFAILTISERGQGKNGNAVFVRDLEKGGKDFKPVFPDIGNDSYNVVDNVGGMLLVETDYK